MLGRCVLMSESGAAEAAPGFSASTEPSPLLAFRLAGHRGFAHRNCLDNSGAGPAVRFTHGDNLAGSCVAADLTSRCHGYGLFIGERFQAPVK